MTGGGKEILGHIKGGFSRNLWTRATTPKSRFLQPILNKLGESILIDWKMTGLKDAPTVDSFLKDISKDGIPDIFLSEITFEIPWTQYNTYTMHNEDTWIDWNFTPYNFKPGVWQALKAELFPAKALFNQFKTIRKELVKDLDEQTKKRWRDTLLLNKPHDELENQEIRVFWQNKAYALLLKEAKGTFSLMDLGEWRL